MQEKKNPRILNAGQLSLILNISEQTVKKLAKDREIPCTFYSGRPQFNLNELLKHFKKIEEGGIA